MLIKEYIFCNICDSQKYKTKEIPYRLLGGKANITLPPSKE